MIFLRIILVLLFPIAFVVDTLLLIDWFSGSHVGEASYFGITRRIVRNLKGKKVRADNSGQQMDAAPAVELQEDEGLGLEAESTASLHQAIGPRWVGWVVWSVVAAILVFAGYVFILMVVGN